MLFSVPLAHDNISKVNFAMPTCFDVFFALFVRQRQYSVLVHISSAFINPSHSEADVTVIKLIAIQKLVTVDK